MKKNILTFGLTSFLIIFSLAVGAQTPQRKGNEAAKPSALTSVPDSVLAEEVQFKGDNIVLDGTLFLPKNKAGQKVPAILMVADFYSLRDGIKVNKGQHNTYADLATHFVQRGFAVLRYDRRCTGKSECAPNATLAVTADDGFGGVTYLLERKEIDPKNIFVFGHGDGSLVATGIAGHKEVAGAITTVAPGRSANKLLRDWANLYIKDHRLSEAEGAKYLAEVEALITRLGAGGTKGEAFSIDPKDELLFPLVKSPDYSYSWLIDDPLALYSLVHGSVLVLHGGKDRRIGTRDGAFIHDALKTGDHKDFETVVLPEMDYYLKVNKGAPSVEVDNDIARPLDPALLKLVDEWLAKKIK